ncbi:MAG: hypothetical protein JSS86_15220 [Cyanobacteria bacterium SZAS LIN-2]|nr:hypothetical protein [Cyanobacteria bacterium SZAS LIN-2]
MKSIPTPNQARAAHSLRPRPLLSYYHDLVIAEIIRAGGRKCRIDGAGFSHETFARLLPELQAAGWRYKTVPWGRYAIRYYDLKPLAAPVKAVLKLRSVKAA